MPNANRPAGFYVNSHGSGGLPNRLSRYHIASGGAFNILRGDAVVPTATSKNIARPTAATDRLQGVFDGCFYQDATLGPVYSPRWPTGTVPLAGTTPDAYVYDDPKILFVGQASAGFVLADVGALADLSIGVGSPATGTSGDQIDSTTFASGAVFKIEDIYSLPDNDYGTNAKVIVSISKHYRSGASTAI